MSDPVAALFTIPGSKGWLSHYGVTPPGVARPADTDEVVDRTGTMNPGVLVTENAGKE